MKNRVKIWEEEVWIPTYGVGKPEKNPMFFEKRVYQGSSGVVYPYPIIEKIEDTCEEKSYKAVFLENEYLKIMVLPELGGRIQMAYDKIKQRHFIYYNHVIKPALVGLTGPWISGGIEFNWPQHHRPSTFLPVDYTFETCEDGSAIVWVSERERMFHQKGMAGITLRPGRAVLEIKGKLYNPTPIPQTFLWWANPAVAVNEHYQSVFPADVNAVFDHGKRDVSTYPIATGVYYKMDYSEGVDISKYKNIPVPTSYMAINSKYDFVGGYENDTQAGVLHVANHYISPGKKQWTWGYGDFGQAWDRNLTDEDGPYIELMTGIYTDNQPDFTWLQPYEEKSFTQYFLPYRELGVVKNATEDLLLNIEQREQEGIVKLFATSVQKGNQVLIKQEGKVLLDVITDLSPEKVFQQTFVCNSLQQVKVWIFSENGKQLLFWEPEPEEVKPVPDPAEAIPAPEQIATVEELYLAGLHLEQYRHATYNPVDYYLEALKREPLDIRNNNAMGLWLIRKGQFKQAECYLRKAVEALTKHNPNPYEGEPLYNLGLALKYQGRENEAYGYFYKATWNAAWQDAAYYSLAQISCKEGRWISALSEVEYALIRNYHNHRARHLQVILLRNLEKKEEALSLIQESLEIDAFNWGCQWEKYLLTNDCQDLDLFSQLMRKENHNYIELALDYASAGCWKEALMVIDRAISELPEVQLITFYFKAWFLYQQGNKQKAIQVIEEAERKSVDYCFPNQLEAIGALQCCTQLVNHTPKAWYLLGNLWYDKRQYPEAIAAWEYSLELDPSFPTVRRNLSLACFNKLGKKEEAVSLLEKAFELDSTDGRILMELDQLYKRLKYPVEFRFAFLEKHKEVVWDRDDLYLEYITLLNQQGRYEEAITLLTTRNFHPWEGGEGKVPAQYQHAHLRMAQRYLNEDKLEIALSFLDQCYSYPANLGEGKLYGALENDFDYYKGCILEKMGDKESALLWYEKATQGNLEPQLAQYYNDQQPDKIFYQGLAFRKLGKEKEARNRFNQLISYGEENIHKDFKIDYFAVSLPDLQVWEDDLNQRKKDHCNYMMGLGYLGLEEKAKAESYFVAADIKWDE